ncbi:MAG: UMP kinase [Spirochaetales bacterium]|nr:UMP kinase [Spirochaetales bacterium]
MRKLTVLSLGGSIIAPAEVDTLFLAGFVDLIMEKVTQGERFIIVTGGGGPARAYQAAYRVVAKTHSNDAQDWIGITATRLNAQLVKALFADLCVDPVVCDPTGKIDFTGSVLVAAGWKPGFSSDYDAVLLAERFGAETLINLSNINRVFSADPKEDPQATPYDTLTWEEMRSLVGDQWVPGKNTPFDPVAARKATALRLQVVIAAGKDLENLNALLAGKPFVGTRIGPD